MIKLKYIQHPAYTDEQWKQRNPLLRSGEIAVVLNPDTLYAEAFKIGAGKYSDLPLMGVDKYQGDPDGTYEGTSLADVLYSMRNPYLPPVISNPINNASGIYAKDSIIELGNSITAIGIQYTVTNQGNMNDTDPINVISGEFDNDGDFPFGNITLTKSTPIAPTAPKLITISLKVKGDNDLYSDVTQTTITFAPKIIGGVSQKSSLTSVEVNSIGNKITKVTMDYKGTYRFNASGYWYIAIPDSINPQNLKWTASGNDIDMTSIGLMEINNGAASYNYHVYRTTYKMLSSGTINIA